MEYPKLMSRIELLQRNIRYAYPFTSLVVIHMKNGRILSTFAKDDVSPFLIDT